jgi:arylsulfatase A-like enzyme
MAAIGPDFKKQYVDHAPVSNADIAPTLAQILGFGLASKGKLLGRVLRESLASGPPTLPFDHRTAISGTAANDKATVLMYQQLGKQVYFDQACFKVAPANKAENPCP